MRATIAWSVALLRPPEQVLFRRLSVFVGGGTLGAIEAVCLDPEGAEPVELDLLDGLGALVDQSLVKQREETALRFGMLHVIREYALERLEASGELEALRKAQASYFLATFEPEDYLQVVRQQGTEWMVDIEREHDNVRTALDWACAREEVELGLRLGASVAGFWVFRGHPREGRRWLETLVALGVGSRLGEERVRGAEAVAAVKRRAGPAAARAWAYALEYAGLLAGDREDKVALHEESVVAARALGDRIAVAAGLHFLGLGVLTTGDIPRGLALLEEGLDLARQLKDKPELLTAELTQYGSALLLVPGEEARAISMIEESLELAQRMDIPGYTAVPRLVLARISRHRGDLTRASTLMSEALRVIWDYGLTLYVPEFLDELALIAEGQGRMRRAAQLLGAVARAFETTGFQPDPVVHPEIEAMVARGRVALGDKAWEAAFADGRALTLEGAVAEALD
jgi:non-specific serine/threonine protein kinase